jgi:hypothetical protein
MGVRFITFLAINTIAQKFILHSSAGLSCLFSLILVALVNKLKNNRIGFDFGGYY